jgi:Ca-activated chloride channel family protein
LLVIYLASIFFYFFRYKKILKKNRKLLLKFEKKKLLISLILELIYITSIFLIALSFVGIYLPLGIKKDKVYLFLIDTSGSMQANDFKPSRLEVAKDITKEFIEKNKGYFGIVAFSDYPLLVQYPTKNKEEIFEKLKTLQAQGGTDLGDTLKTAYSILDNFVGYDKYIILLSDGKPTQGENPLKVVRKDIPIFTVALGSNNMILGYDPFGRPLIAEVDKELLKKLAEISNGKFFEATQTEELIRAYEEISKISNQKELNNISPYLIKISFVLLLLSFLAKIYLTLV